MITVFTPTYNRAHLLPRLYESLLRQSFQDFEWICVDDGSTDNSQETIERLISEHRLMPNSFPIKYYKKENGGKHTAINAGVKSAEGELFFIADSDDLLPDDALQTVVDVWESIKDRADFAGICGLDGKLGRGGIIGSGLPEDKTTTTITLTDGSKIRCIDGNNMEVRFGMGITGDMKEVFRTSVLKEFPFPEIAGERFCPEVLVWNRIATKYKLRYIDKVIYLAEYQEGGLTAGITKARINSPMATMMTYQEMTTYDIPAKQKVKAAINYWRFRMCSKPGEKQMPRLKWYWNVVSPIGWLMHLRDMRAVTEH